MNSYLYINVTYELYYNKFMIKFTNYPISIRSHVIIVNFLQNVSFLHFSCAHERVFWDSLKKQ